MSMENRARGLEGRDTMKQEKGKGRRQVLGDIGNLDVFRIKEGKKISQPITRNLHAKSLANAEATTNVIVPALDIEADVHMKYGEDWTRTPDPEPLDVAHFKKIHFGCEGKCMEISNKKAKCEILREPEYQPADNVADDANNELAEVEYVDELHNFYKLTEVKSRVSDYMKSQNEINEKMRSITVDWLVDVHMEFKLRPETLFLTINIFDRYLSLTNVPKTELQLVGICSMLIACKYEEILSPKINNFIDISADTYTRNQILSMEIDILEKLQRQLTVPTTYMFLVRLVKATLVPDKEMENLAFYLAELGMHYKVVILYSPSMIAAGAVYSARCTLRRSPLWSETLQKQTGYCTEQIMDCVKLLVSLQASAAESKEQQALYWKFLSRERGSVALLSPPKYIVKNP